MNKNLPKIGSNMNNNELSKKIEFRFHFTKFGSFRFNDLFSS